MVPYLLLQKKRNNIHLYWGNEIYLNNDFII